MSGSANFDLSGWVLAIRPLSERSSGPVKSKPRAAISARAYGPISAQLRDYFR